MRPDKETPLREQLAQGRAAVGGATRIGETVQVSRICEATRNAYCAAPDLRRIMHQLEPCEC